MVKFGVSVLIFIGMEWFYFGVGNDIVNGVKVEIFVVYYGILVYGLIVYGGDGNDSIIGILIVDFIDGGVGNDMMCVGVGDDVIQFSIGDDLIYGGVGNDNICWG